MSIPVPHQSCVYHAPGLSCLSIILQNGKKCKFLPLLVFFSTKNAAILPFITYFIPIPLQIRFKKQKEQDLETIIKDEKLKHDEAQKFIENSFRDGEIKTTGTDLDKILPPMSRFSGGSNRALKKQTVIDKIKSFFEKYFGLI